MGTVKSYDVGETIVVQYFDSGSASRIKCPKCQWSGDVPCMPFINDGGTVELSCMECPVKLALIFASELLHCAEKHG